MISLQEASSQMKCTCKNSNLSNLKNTGPIIDTSKVDSNFKYNRKYLVGKVKKEGFENVGIFLQEIIKGPRNRWVRQLQAGLEIQKVQELFSQQHKLTLTEVHQRTMLRISKWPLERKGPQLSQRASLGHINTLSRSQPFGDPSSHYFFFQCLEFNFSNTNNNTVTGRIGGLKAHERQKMKRKTPSSSFSLDFLFPCQARGEIQL